MLRIFRTVHHHDLGAASHDDGDTLASLYGASPADRGCYGRDVELLAGPAPREVPPLDGLTVERARIALQEAQLELAIDQAYSESVGEGLIFAVDPAPGASVSRGSGSVRSIASPTG